MPFDLDRAAAFMAAQPAQPTAWPPGAPARDFTRSPAAARVGELASHSGLFLFHFERRAHLPLPAAWLPDGADPELGEPPQWVDGVLPEAKYQSFRHDGMVGSFHPGHRGKWTTHELCHALVGFAWHPGASPLFHATAARLAELLPVVLYYFLDEVRLRRCDDHRGGGPLFRGFCPACEDAAEEGPAPWCAADGPRLSEARHYLDQELAAIARTRRLGRPIGFRWGSLDLCTDGLAYAAAHGRRLQSAAFERFAEGFLHPGGGCWSSLEALEERVVAVARALTEGSELPALAPSGAEGRLHWVASDLAWRLHHEAEVAPEGRRKGLLRAAELLQGAERTEAGLAAAVAGVRGAEALIAGYRMDGVTADGGLGLAEGLGTACPLVLDAFEDAGVDPVPAFAEADEDLRLPLADRFARWCAVEHGAELACLARFEAALRHAGSEPMTAALGPGEGAWSVSPYARDLEEAVDPIGLADRVESGEVVGMLVDGRVELRELDGAPLAREPTRVVVARSPAGEVAVAELEGADPELLAELGMVRFDRWPGPAS